MHFCENGDENASLLKKFDERVILLGKIFRQNVDQEICVVETRCADLWYVSVLECDFTVVTVYRSLSSRSGQ
jgi:hypothetical protein